MQKLRLIALPAMLFVLNNAISQITITSAAMPVSGDTIRFSTVSPAVSGLNLNQKGANQSWDYSNLVSNGQDIYQYLAANKTPYLFYFFNQLGLKTADSFGISQFSFKNIYSFYTKSSSVFKAEGLGYSFSGIPLASNYTDEDEIYQFPLNYNDSDVSTFRFLFSIPGQTQFSVVQTGKRTNVVDGWGSIVTPYKTYPNVLRVKTTIDEVDSLISQFVKLPFPRKQVIYKWLSADEHIPVLEITGTEAGNVFTATQIRFRDSFNGKGSPIAPRARFTVDKTSGYANADTFSFTDQTTPFATGFQWQFTPTQGIQFVSNTTAASRNPRVVFSGKGLYTVTLIASNPGGSDDTTAADLIQISFGAAVKNTDLNILLVYPNPNPGIFYLKGFESMGSIPVYDPSGRICTQAVRQVDGSFTVEKRLRSGLYYLKTGENAIRLMICEP